MNDEDFQARLNAISTPVKKALDTPGQVKSKLWNVYHTLTGKGSVVYRRISQVGDMLGRLANPLRSWARFIAILGEDIPLRPLCR